MNVLASALKTSARGLAGAPERTHGRVSVCFLHPGHVSTIFADSREGIAMHDIGQRRYRIASHLHGYIGKECGTGGIVAGRNDYTRVFLDDSDSEWMFQIDADMGFARDTVERLIAAADPIDRPVVGGLAFVNKPAGGKPYGAVSYIAMPTIYDFVEDDTTVGFVSRIGYERDALVQCDATGAAVVLIHRTVLEAMRAVHGDHWFDPVIHPTGPTTFSEDLSFCVRLADLGIPLHVHTGVRTTHHKGGVYIDEPEFDRQLAAWKAEVTDGDVADSRRP